MHSRKPAASSYEGIANEARDTGPSGLVIPIRNVFAKPSYEEFTHHLDDDPQRGAPIGPREFIVPLGLQSCLSLTITEAFD